MTLQQQIGQTIKQARQRKGWSQKQLSEATGGISRSNIGLIERGEYNLTLKYLQRITDALDITLGINPYDKVEKTQSTGLMGLRIGFEIIMNPADYNQSHITAKQAFKHKLKKMTDRINEFTYEDLKPM